MTPSSSSSAPPDPETAPHLAPVPWGRRRVLRGLQVFVALTLVALLFLYFRGKLGGDLSHLQRLSSGIIVLGVAQAIFDLLAGGARIWVLSRAFGGRIGLGPAVAANGANILLGGITPSQTGGGVAQIYIMVRAGLQMRTAMIASLVSFLCTVLVLLAAGVMVVLLEPSFAMPIGFRWFSGGTVAIFASILALFLAAIPRPDLYRGGLRRHLGRIPGIGSRLTRSAALERLEHALEDFALLARSAGGEQKLKLAAGLLLSALIYLNKFLIAFVILHGLGLGAPLVDVLYLQEIQYLVVYFAPTPGASGLAELSAAEIMAPLVPAGHLSSYLVLWRAFSLYLPMTCGALLLLRRVLRRTPSDSPVQAHEST